MTYKSIEVDTVHLNANAYAIHSNVGYGKLDHIIHKVGDSDYQSMSESGIYFSIPTDPPIHLFQSYDANGPVITDINRRHKEEVRTFQEYKDTDSTFKHNILVDTEDDYITELKHAKIRYARVTTINRISHLYYWYGTMKPEMI